MLSVQCPVAYMAITTGFMYPGLVLCHSKIQSVYFASQGVSGTGRQTGEPFKGDLKSKLYTNKLFVTWYKLPEGKNHYYI